MCEVTILVKYLTFATIILASPIYSLRADDTEYQAPFELHWGWTKDDIRRAGWKIREGSTSGGPPTYVISKKSGTTSGTISPEATIDTKFGRGLQRLYWLSEKITNDKDGKKGKEKYNELKKNVF